MHRPYIISIEGSVKGKVKRPMSSVRVSVERNYKDIK